MSLLEKMSIQGIRSFSPDAPQKIEFFNPVTLILGPNGTGKTTIIECLKYSTTGVLPPGSKIGGSFVHDPKLAQEPEVKAKVLLQIRDVRGQKMLVSRVLLATQKERAKQVTMKTLDGSIKRFQADGTPISLSSKCADLDLEMVSSLGVSKAVLENVIFCHQEDSNWPLSEGKMVKERFDDLFASSRYVKALEVILKTRKEHDGQTKIMKESLKHLKKDKDTSKSKKSDVLRYTKQHHAELEKKEKLDEEYRPFKNQLSQYREKYQEYCDIKSKQESMYKRRLELENLIEDLKSNIKTDFSGSKEELVAAIEESEERFRQNTRSKSDNEEKLNLSKREIQKFEGKKSSLLIEKGKWESSHKNQFEKSIERSQLIQSVANTMEITVSSETLTETEVSDFEKELEHKISIAKRELKKLKKECDEKELEIQNVLDEARAELTKLEQINRSRKEAIEQNRKELREIIAKLGEQKQSPDEIRSDLQELKEKLSKDTTVADLAGINNDISRLRKNKTKLQEKVVSLDTEIDQLHRSSTQHTELNLKEKEKADKEEKARKIRCRHDDILTTLFPSIPKKNIQREFQGVLQKLESANNKKQKFIESLERDVAVLDGARHHINDDLKKRRQLVSDHEEKIYALCDSDDLSMNLDQIRIKKKQLEDDCAGIQGTLYTFGKFKERLQVPKPACPLCCRHFDQDDDVRDLINDIENKLSSAPQDLEQKNKELRKLNKKYDDLNQLVPVFNELKVLKSTEIPRLEDALQTKIAAIAAKKATLSDEKESSLLNMSDYQQATSIRSDITILDKTEVEIEDDAKKIKTFKSSLVKTSSRSLDEVQKDKQTTQKELDSCIRQIDLKQQEIVDSNNRLNSLKGRTNQLEAMVLRLQDQSRVQSDLSRLESEEISSRDLVEPVKEKVRVAEGRLASVQKENAASLDLSNRKIANISDIVRDIGRFKKDLSREQTQMISQKLSSVTETLNQCGENIDRHQSIVETCSRRLEQLTKDLASYETQRRELADILLTRKHSKELDRVNETIVQMKTTLGSGDDLASVDVDRLTACEKKYTEKTRRIWEETTHLSGQIKQIEKDLRDNYADAENKYLNKFYELKTTELASKDLDKYYKALDKAIMTYHSLKMEEINKIIKELWRNTYRGNDIDYIEIRHDEDEATGTAASKNRRTFNYRVAMVKGSTWLDMRGRCSAGQKVLACLVIRLALAEVFCLHCGVLGLDEPTTNLDRENIESLAHALVEIIKSRSQQSNFQLVIITHDEDFVELLGRSDYVEHFFRIGRNNEGLSEITRLRVDEQFH